MKLFWIIVLFSMIPIVGYARDTYTSKVWGSTFAIKSEANVKSIKPLTDIQIQIVVETFKRTRNIFFTYSGIDNGSCRLGPVNVIIVGKSYELDDKKNFPGENVYSDKPQEGNKIVFGRYFAITNNLYILPVNLEKYYWRRNFAHELVHYFLDECGMTFTNIDIEHYYIDMFLKYNKNVFY